MIMYFFPLQELLQLTSYLMLLQWLEIPYSFIYSPTTGLFDSLCVCTSACGAKPLAIQRQCVWNCVCMQLQHQSEVRCDCQADCLLSLCGHWGFGVSNSCVYVCLRQRKRQRDEEERVWIMHTSIHPHSSTVPAETNTLAIAVWLRLSLEATPEDTTNHTCIGRPICQTCLIAVQG